MTTRRIRRFYDKDGKLAEEVEEITTITPSPMKIVRENYDEWRS